MVESLDLALQRIAATPHVVALTLLGSGLLLTACGADITQNGASGGNGGNTGSNSAEHDPPGPKDPNDAVKAAIVMHFTIDCAKAGWTCSTDESPAGECVPKPIGPA